MLAMLIDDDGLKKGLSQQITFITLKQILSIKQKNPPIPSSQWTISRWTEYQPKSQEKYMLFLQSSFASTSCKNS